MLHIISQWILPPATISELATLHGYAEVLLKDKAATHEVYNRALTSYVRHLEQLNVFLPGWSERFAYVCPQLEVAEIKALLHRVNCQVLQILAHGEACNQPCCCRCPAAYPDIPCLRPILGQIALSAETASIAN